MTNQPTTRVAVIREPDGQDACHAVGCSDLAKARKRSDLYYEQPSLAQAELEYDQEFEDWDEPYVWKNDVKVYPCAKK